MKRQVYNPFLALDEYVPDGEPHVFGDRVYLYGSHDAAGAERFCVRDYTVWSAPVDDLTDWTCHGVTYRKEQDARAKDGKLPDYYAPDCVRAMTGGTTSTTWPWGPTSKTSAPCRRRCPIPPPGPLSTWGTSVGRTECQRQPENVDFRRNGM